VAVVLDQALDQLLGQQEPLATAAGAPLGELFADLFEGHRRVRVGQENTKNRFQRGHVAMDVVLGSAAVLANALEWVAAIGRAMDLKAHAAGGFVKDGRALVNFLANFGSAGVAHSRAHDIVERKVVLLKPGWVGVVIASFFRTIARAAGIGQTPRSIDHSGFSFGSGRLARGRLGEHLVRNVDVGIYAVDVVKILEALHETHHRGCLIDG
jgi:hypothetical protein